MGKTLQDFPKMILFKLSENSYTPSTMDACILLNSNSDKKEGAVYKKISKTFSLFFKNMVFIVSHNLMVGEICHAVKFSCKYN